MFDIDKILFMRNTGKILPDAKIEDILFAKKLRSAMEKLVTIVGNPLTFTTKKSQLAKSTKISMEPIQEGSGDPSPSNIRPITGRTGVTLNGCGKNKVNMIADNIVVGKYIDNNGVEQSSYANFYYSEPIPVKALTAYTMNVSDSVWFISFMEYDSNNTFIKRTLYGSSSVPAGKTVTITTDANTAYILFGSNIFRNDPVTLDNILALTWMLSEGSTAADYEPYQSSNEITISFGETVYGGTLDVEKGELTVDKQYYIFDNADKINDLTRVQSSEGTAYFRTRIYGITTSGILPRGCSHFPNASVVSSTTVEGYYAYTSSSAPNDMYINFRYPEEFTTNSACRAWFTEQLNNGTPVQCWFTLATPITVSLTPEQVQLLKGVNNLWTDGDSIELTYKA